MQTIKKRKGFTLTELAIVIAVIAILIAVLVPTFVSLINKAQETNDSMLVKNLNTSMSTYASLNGKEEDEIDVIEALTALEDDGYTLSKLTPTSTGANIVYNQSTHTFILFKDNYAEDSDISTTGDYVVIGCSTSGVQAAYTSSYNITKFCVYATDGTDIECTYNTNNGTEVTIYLYSESGTVNINTPYATVEHYGSAEIVNINAVAYASYHLHGKVGELTLAKGHAELKSTAVVDTVEIAPADGETPVLTVVTGAKVEEYKVEENSNYKVETKTSDDAETTTETTVTEIASASGAILNQNITLTADRTDGLTVAANTVIVLDLNGYTLTNSSSAITVLVNEGATLTITDSSTAQSGMISGECTIKNSGSLIVEKGTITGTNRAIQNSDNGTITINGGSLKGDSYGIYAYNYSNIVINDGVITSNYGVYMSSVGSLEINGGTITASARGVNMYSGTLNMTNGTITAQNSSSTSIGIFVNNNLDVSISGGTITSTSSGANYSYGIYTYGNVVISGDTKITSDNSTENTVWTYGVLVYVNDTSAGSLTISGEVEIKATNSSNGSVGVGYFGNGEYYATSVTISGGTISGGSYGVSGNGSASYSAVTISGGAIIGGIVGYYHPEMGTLKITGGSITGYLAGLQVCAGTIKISGGTFTSTADADDIAADANNVAKKTGDGIIADGAALSIINRSGYGLTQNSGSCSFGEGSIEISGGEFVSACENSILAYSYNSSTGASTWAYTNYISITGGTYTIGTITVDSE